MSIKIKNWKLAVLALVFFCFLTSLGVWQLSRAQQKRELLANFAQRTQQIPMTTAALSHPNDWRFYRASFEGNFDNEHTLLLDNKTFQGKVGYEVYTPFQAKGLNTAVLIDRGFVPANPDRAILPDIRPINGPVTVTGLLNLPPAYVSLGGGIQASKQRTWPLRVEYIQLQEIGQILDYPFFPYVLQLAPNDPSAYQIEWQITVMSPERHMGYAAQWFALALTLLILFVALNRE